MSVSEQREEPAAGGAGRALGRRPRGRCGDHVERPASAFVCTTGKADVRFRGAERVIITNVY